MVSLMDLPVTMLDCAGIEKPEQFAGNSLLRLVKGTAESWPESIFMQISESQVGRAVRTKEWKYSVRAQEDGWSNSCADRYYEDFLYDLKNDPHERVNLAADPQYALIREKMKGILLDWMKKAGEALPEILPCQQMPEEMRN